MSTEIPEDQSRRDAEPAIAGGGNDPGSAPGGGPSPRAPRRLLGRLARALGGMLALLLVLAVLAGAALYGALHYERGTRLAWQAATALLNGRLSGSFEGGTLEHGLRLRNVAWRSGGTEIKLDQLAAQWQLTRKPWRFTLDYLHIGTLETRFAPTTEKQSSTGLPKDLQLPLQLEIRDVRVDHIVLHQGSSTTSLNGLSARGSSDGRHHQLTLDGLQTEYGSAFAAFQLDGVRPFNLSGSARFSGTLNQQAVQANATLSGSLELLKADIDASGMKLAGHAYVEALPFGAVPLKVVKLAADHLDPRSFSPSAPAADLSLRAQLQPVPGTNAAAGLVVAGSVSLVNAHPGALDQQLLPLIDAHANVRLDARQQSLSDLTVRLVKNATVSGAGTLRGDQGRFDLRADKLDLHALQASLRPTQLAGPITIALAGQRQIVKLDLADPKAAMRAQANVTLDPAQLSLDTVKLSFGAGHADLKGTLKHDARASYALKATLTDFDPLALLDRAPATGKTQQRKRPAASKTGRAGHPQAASRPAPSRAAFAAGGKPIQAKVSGSFDATGALAPGFSTKTAFTLRDSSYDGLPLTGAGVLQLAGAHLLPSKAQLSIAGNNVDVQGSFGRPGERLRFRIDAPALDRLGFGVAGAIKADGDLSGSLAHPNVVANYQADAVVLGANRIGHAAGRAELRDGVNGAMVLSADARDVVTGGVALKTLSAHLDGTRAAHTLNLAASGTALGRPLDFDLAARGRLADTPAGMAWDGTITNLENRGLPALKLLDPLTVSAGPGRVTLGATRLTLERATLDLQSLVYDHGRLRSAGAITDLGLNRLLQINQEVTGQPPPIRTDLVLDGDWNFALAGTATGYLQIKRRAGDISVDAGRGVAALGLSELSARAQFMAGNRLQASVSAKAARLGTLDAEAEAPLSLRDGVLTVAADAPLKGHVDARIPSLATTGALLGPRYIFDGRLALALVLAGQVGHPNLSGTFNGDDLSATLVDQGVQLKQGIVRLALSENLVEFKQVEFHGASGVLRATGKIRLDQADPDLSAQIVADKLELFAAPDRQLSLSGSATVANGGAAGGMDINGKFTVDHALFDLPESAAPQLGDDVVVVRPDGTVQGEKKAGQPVAEKPVSRFTPRANIAVDLGRAFRFRGVGADLGLRGTITAQSAPGEPLRAVGNVRVTEGSTYTSFGRKLAIENGFFTFNGPVDNPGVNILAMRRNQEVEAGVQVTGTLQSPNVRLVSQPSVADNEKLSWLLFGHGTDQGNNMGQQSTMTAALALLGNASGKRIAQTIGLDEFSVGTSEVGLTDPQVITVSKALNERLVLGYEQGLTTAGNVLKATLNLSRFWAVTAYAGTLNGVDLLFNRRFDGGKKSPRGARGGAPSAAGTASEVAAKQ